MRELTLFELALVSGGDGTCEGDGEEADVCITHPPYTPPYTPPSFPPSYPPPSYEPPPASGGGSSPSSDVGIGGDPCPVSRAEAAEALNNLQAGSPTAAGIVAAARAAGLSIILNSNHIDHYNPIANYISWDPFSASQGQNADQSYWTESPTLGLMHELIHWNSPQLSHDAVYALVNTIARELNQNTGTNYSANRTSVGGSAFLVNDTDGTNYDLGTVRPVCGS